MIMRMIINVFLVSIVLCLSACRAPRESSATLINRTHFIFGTLVEISVWAKADERTEAALAEVEQALNDMHHQWHAWKPGRLAQINRALRAGEAVQLRADEAAFIQRAQALSLQSGGHFNPAIGELIHLWGFHSDEFPIAAPPPERAQIEAFVQQRPDMRDLHFDGAQLRSSHARIWLDFGGIAKGLAVDRACEILQRHGLHNAIVNAGGDLRSIGRKGTQDWRIAIRSPVGDGVLASLQVRGDEAIFTSGNYQRYKQHNGQRYAHILDPASGWPVQQIISATVIAADGVSADAAATALIVAGTEHWRAVAHAMGIEQALLIDSDNRCHATAAMHRRLQPADLPCALDDADTQAARNPLQ